jgi:hypothetical protein
MSNRRPELARRFQTDIETDYEPDERLDSITNKVIDYMHATPAEEWGKEVWAIFKTVWATRPKRKTTDDLATKTPEELQQMISGARSNS